MHESQALIVGEFVNGEPQGFTHTRDTTVEGWKETMGHHGTITPEPEMDREDILAYRFSVPGVPDRFFAVQIPEKVA
jgi:hypothetical protein